MPIVVLNEIRDLNIGPMALTCPKTGMPRFLANMWLSLNEQKYSPGYTAQHLRALDMLYTYFENSSAELKNLDETVIQGEVDELTRGLRGFVAERQNIANSTGKDQSAHVQMACAVISSALDELRHKNKRLFSNSAQINRATSNINTLYRFLRPPRASKVRTIRSLPTSVMDELIQLLRPDSNANPFRTRKLKIRNFILFSLLYQMGLRRGELLNLSSNCMKAQFDSETERVVYWLNIRPPKEHDTRSKKPKLKNEYSTRQLPVSKSLYGFIDGFVTNYRGRSNHGFLIGSQKGNPLSERALNSIFETISNSLSKETQELLREQCGSPNITPHQLRHTAAVDRIRGYRKSGIEMDNAEALMRVFFGWSPQSNMPRLYAKAFYVEQLNTTWLEEFDKRVSDIMNYEKN